MINTPELRVGNWVYDGTRTQFPMFIDTVGKGFAYLDFENNELGLGKQIPQTLKESQ